MTDNLRRHLKILRYLPQTIWFNFMHLPFRQAVKLPILLYKPRLTHNTGRFRIEGPVSYGMIRLGFPTVSIFPNDGIVIENCGELVFRGRCFFGSGSALSVGEKGRLEIGDDVLCNAGFKLVCYHSVTIGSTTRFGWCPLIMDTDLHSLKPIDSKKRSKAYGPIKIGSHVWVASYCKIYKHTDIPDFCTVTSNTIVSSKVEAEPYSIIFNPRTVETKFIGRYRDPSDDVIDYE